MAGGGDIRDPVLGVMRLRDEQGEYAFFQGEAPLTPKHRVEIDFAFLKRDDTWEECLAVARGRFERIRRSEWELRVAAAEEIVPDIWHASSETRTPEGAARRMRLVRIDLDSDRVGWVLRFALAAGWFRHEAVIVYCDEDGSVEDCELD